MLSCMSIHKTEIPYVNMLATLKASTLRGFPTFCIHLFQSAHIRQIADVLSEVHVRLDAYPTWEENKKIISNSEGTKSLVQAISLQEMGRRLENLRRWDLDPQKGVEDRYMQLEDPIPAMNAKLKSKGPQRMYTKEDYTPLQEKKKSYESAKKLFRSIKSSPNVISDLVNESYIDPRNLQPKRKMWDWIKEGHM